MCSRLSTISGISPVLFVFVAILVVTILTEFSSNSATAVIFIPLIATVVGLYTRYTTVHACTQAQSANVHPLYYMLPVALACSYAFMLPAATPSNSIVFDSGLIGAADMVGTLSRVCTVDVCRHWLASASK